MQPASLVALLACVLLVISPLGRVAAGRMTPRTRMLRSAGSDSQLNGRHLNSGNVTAALRPPPARLPKTNVPPAPPPQYLENFFYLRPVKASELVDAYTSWGDDGMHLLNTWNADPKNDNWRPFGSLAAKGLDEEGALSTYPMYWGYPSNPLVARSPLSWEWVWNNENTGSDQSGSSWRPVCPKGYSNLGDVFVGGWLDPSNYGAGLDRVWCAVDSCVEQCATNGSWIWDTTENGGKHEAQIFGVGGKSITLGTFRVQLDPYPTERNVTFQTCLKERCKKTIALAEIKIVQMVVENVTIKDNNNSVVDMFTTTNVVNENPTTSITTTKISQSFTNTVQSEWSQRLTAGFEYTLEVGASVSYLGLVNGDITTSYTGTVGYEMGTATVSTNTTTWTYEQEMAVTVAPHTSAEVVGTWKQANNVKIPYEVTYEVTAVHLDTKEYVETQDDIKALLVASGFEGEFGMFLRNGQGKPVLQAITHGEMSGSFSSAFTVTINCEPLSGYPKACEGVNTETV